MTPSPDQTIAISTQDHKLASLLFDRLYPLNVGDSIPEQIRYVDHTLIDEEVVNAIVQTVRSLEDKEYSDTNMAIIENSIASEIHKRFASRGIPSVPIFHSVESYQQYLVAGHQEASEIKLCRIPIIDTAKLEWDQILSIRSDPDFKKKLRRFRLFLSDNYEGQNEQYIKDSLLQKLDEYEEICKKHGLLLITSTISQVLNSKSLLGTLGISATAILTGNVRLAAASAIAGSVIELGKIAIHVTEKRLAFEHGEGNSEISYLIDIQERSKKG